jgi:hypothetical protein
MQARVNDRIHIRGRTVESPDRNGLIVEIHGANGEPPYLVRFDDGHETLVFPGTDTVVEHSSSAAGAELA